MYAPHWYSQMHRNKLHGESESCEKWILQLYGVDWCACVCVSLCACVFVYAVHIILKVNLIYNYIAVISLVSIMKVAPPRSLKNPGISCCSVHARLNARAIQNGKSLFVACFGETMEFNLISLSSYHVIQSMAHERTRRATYRAFQWETWNEFMVLVQFHPMSRKEQRNNEDSCCVYFWVRALSLGQMCVCAQEYKVWHSCERLFCETPDLRPGKATKFIVICVHAC